MGYEYQEYPKTLYRKGADGFVVGRTFASEAEVEAGWRELTDIPEAKFKPEAEPEAAPLPESQAPKLKDSADLLQAELDASNRLVAAQSELIGEYRAFVAEVATAETLDAVRAKAIDLGAAATAPVEKPKKKARAQA